jgi:hypothetical protein
MNVRKFVWVVCLHTCLLTAESFSEVTLVNEAVSISTADRGDGKPGLGADTWLREGFRNIHRGRFKKFLMARTSSKDNAIVLLRFDLSLLKGKTIKSAKLNLFSLQATKNSIQVRGLNDSIRSKGEYFLENNLDYDDFFAITADGNSATEDWNMDASEILGSFKNPYDNKFIEFSSDELVKFINKDQNGVVVIMLQGGLNTATFSSRESGLLNAPKLVLGI